MKDVIEFLSQYKELEQEYLRHSHRVRELENLCARKAAISRRVNRKETDIQKIFEEELEWRRKKLQKALLAQKQIEDFVDGVEGEKNRTLLRLRYLERLDWLNVTHRLEKSRLYYSEEHVRHYLRREAIAAAQKSWRERTQTLQKGENWTREDDDRKHVLCCGRSCRDCLLSTDICIGYGCGDFCRANPQEARRRLTQMEKEVKCDPAEKTDSETLGI